MNVCDKDIELNVCCKKKVWIVLVVEIVSWKNCLPFPGFLNAKAVAK